MNYVYKCDEGRMTMENERMIIDGYDGNYYFYDYPEDYERKDGIGAVDISDEIGFHQCKKSGLYEDLTGYIDTVQGEEILPDGNYIVTYFYLDKNFDLQQLVDYNISKSEIIQNVINQKYVEGADYFLMEQLVKY